METETSLWLRAHTQDFSLIWKWELLEVVSGASEGKLFYFLF